MTRDELLRAGAVAVVMDPTTPASDLDAVRAFGRWWAAGVDLWCGPPPMKPYVVLIAPNRERLEKKKSQNPDYVTDGTAAIVARPHPLLTVL